TFARNSKHQDSVIYFGPMGCRTGFYFIVRDNVSHDEVISLIKDAFEFISNYEGDIPGVSARECGNYLDHDLLGAKSEAAEYLKTLQSVTSNDIYYK
ncbi:MAG: S-ribosylhomocysteine lyase, partial [Clostridia bacterium]|nr:S-ribosylhomocysteine lyase [Clostridia bacterium]